MGLKGAVGINQQTNKGTQSHRAALNIQAAKDPQAAYGGIPDEHTSVATNPMLMT